MSNGTKKKILIVGAGPVGLTAAIELTRRGFQLRIIDKATGPAGESRAFGIHARTLEIFEPAGITPLLLNAGNRVNRSVFHDATGEYMRINFNLVRQKYNFVIMLPQSKTERILEQHLNSQGIQVEWNTGLDSFAPESLENTDGLVQCVVAGESAAYDLVIGSDGAHSTVRERLGIGFDGKLYPHDWELVDVRFSAERPIDEIRIKHFGNNVLAYFPLEKNLGRFVFSGPDIMDVVKQELNDVEIVWQSSFRISHRIVETYQRGNVFLAGDAAHIHSPMGGRGMNLGIEDAATLAWLIENAATDRYTSLRLPLGKKVLKLTHRQTRSITSGGGVDHFLNRRIVPLLMKTKLVQRMFFRMISGANTPRPEWLRST
jgi:2-polyprenyl-6-methoxyphenol hydroxylase-like FAD-dependent oxidoreductase